MTCHMSATLRATYCAIYHQRVCHAMVAERLTIGSLCAGIDGAHIALEHVLQVFGQQLAFVLRFQRKQAYWTAYWQVSTQR